MRSGGKILAASTVALCTAIAEVSAEDACSEADVKVLGEKVFQKCAVCHSVEADAPHGAGPNLHGLMNRPVGKVEGFKFSKRMRKSEHLWTPEHLDAFLELPADLYPRNRMAFSGLKKPEDRAAVLCYLQAKAAR